MDFKQAQQFTQMAKEAEKMKERLANTEVEAESNGLVITIAGDMTPLKVEFEDTKILGNKELLEKAMLECMKKAFNKITEISMESSQEIMKKMTKK